MAKKKLKGVVVSNKMKKTVVVEVLKFKYFLKYKKRYRFHKKYKAHTEQDYQIGDRVLIEECRPLSRDKRWRFHYYGGDVAHVLAMAKRFNLVDTIVVHDNVPREEALSAVRGAGIAVTITTITKVSTPEDMGIVPAKIFEAIGLGTPVLLVSPTGSDAEMIAQTAGLAGSFSGNDVNGITSFIHNVINGNCPPKKTPEVFAWTNTAKLLDKILRSIVKEGPSKR